MKTPETFEELLEIQMFRPQTTKVIKTPYSGFAMGELPEANRKILQEAYDTLVLSVALKGNIHTQPGTQITIEDQTDLYWASRASSNNTILMNIITSRYRNR